MIVILTALLILSFGAGSARAFESVHMGPSAGLTFASPTALEAPTARDLTSGRAAGFALRYRTVFGLRPDLAVEVTPGFARWGGEFGYEQVDPQNAARLDTTAGELRFGAIELGVRGRWRAGSIAGVSITAWAGPALSLRLVREVELARVRFDSGTGVSEVFRSTDTLDESPRLVPSAAGGLEFARPVGEFQVSLGVAYHSEFGDTLGSGDPDASGPALTGGRLHGIEILLGMTTRLQ